jgi:hypothetical protein
MWHYVRESVDVFVQMERRSGRWCLVVQQSLFEAGGGTPMVESAGWIEVVMLG